MTRGADRHVRLAESLTSTTRSGRRLSIARYEAPNGEVADWVVLTDGGTVTGSWRFTGRAGRATAKQLLADAEHMARHDRGGAARIVTPPPGADLVPLPTLNGAAR